MELSHLIDILLQPFQAFNLFDQWIHWFYLSTSVLIAYILFALRDKKNLKDPRFFAYCFPRKIYGHISSRVDVFYYVVKTIVFLLIVAPFIIQASFVSEFINSQLSAFFPMSHSEFIPIWFKFVLFNVGIILALDLCLFFSHMATHRIGMLWEFHKVHHSAQVLMPLTVYRMHLVDDFLALTLGALGTGTFQGVFTWLFGATPHQWIIGGLNMFFFLFYLFGYHLRHSHVWFSYGNFWNRIFISPAQHQIHHSKAKEHVDKNFGFLFAFWDGWWGSLVVPDKKMDLEFGLSHDEDREYQSVWKLFTLPFIKNVKRIGLIKSENEKSFLHP